jgi:signal transduction histidine kinase
MLEVALSRQEHQDPFLVRSKTAISTSISEIRKLSHTLTTPYFEEENLVDAIESLVDNLNISGRLKAKFSISSEEIIASIDRPRQITLYRIIQEQINNTLKYAEAGNLFIEIKPHHHNLCLSISDDGKGFDNRQKSRGIGLRNMQSRVEFYAGTMEIISAPNQGCTLLVELPLSSN